MRPQLTSSYPHRFNTLPVTKLSHPKNILIVEDDEFTHNLYKIILNDLACHYTLVASGYEALLLAKRNQYDLIILDYNLPDLNGDIICNLLKKDNSKNVTTPIIFVSTEKHHLDKNPLAQHHAIYHKSDLFTTFKSNLISHLYK